MESARVLHGSFLTLADEPQAMLQVMEQATASTSSLSSASFASLLAAMAAPAQNSGVPGDASMSQGKKSAFAWNDDGLEDDVITRLAHFQETSPAASAATPQPAAYPAANPSREAERRCAAPLERNLKDASITIRMSQAECAQLHRRAAEAGLTVSAYLRSCTFETESLRAMVKDTLAQLRSATAPAEPAVAPRRSRIGRLVRILAHWLARLITPWQGNQRVAQA